MCCLAAQGTVTQNQMREIHRMNGVMVFGVKKNFTRMTDFVGAM